MYNILVSNIGFGAAAPQALKHLEEYAHVRLNTAHSRFTEKDLIEKIQDSNILIAGTERITSAVIDRAPKLKLIARVGVGVDNIDLMHAKERKISITYTPEAPAQAVPEFTLSLMLNLLKNISIADRKMHDKIWHRPMGRMIGSLKIGIVGVGKIGSKVIQLIKSIAPSTEILFYDPYVESFPEATKCDICKIFTESDLVSLHLPLNSQTRGLIGSGLLSLMKKGSYLVNTARGELVDENSLYEMLSNSHLAGAALDVFQKEPYEGIFTELDNCLLTSHLGSLTQEVRALMEEQVVEDIVRFLKNEPLLRSLNGFNFRS